MIYKSTILAVMLAQCAMAARPVAARPVAARLGTMTTAPEFDAGIHLQRLNDEFAEFTARVDAKREGLIRSIENVNGYNTWTHTTPGNNKKRALVVSVYGKTGMRELPGVIYDGWYMKRYLESQGYEVVWLKDFTISHVLIHEHIEVCKEKIRDTFEMLSANMRNARSDVQAEGSIKMMKLAFRDLQSVLDNNLPEQWVKRHQDVPGYNVKNMIKNAEVNHIPITDTVINKLELLASLTKAGDHAFFHFSGHGMNTINSIETVFRSGAGVQNAILTARPDHAKWKIADPSLYCNRITRDEFHKAFTSKLPRGSKAILIFDACYSGSMGNLRYRCNVTGDGTIWTDKSDGTNFRDAPLADVITITGSSDEEMSRDAGAAGGVLTSAFLEKVGFYAQMGENANNPECGGKYARERAEIGVYMEGIRKDIKVLLGEVRDRVRELGEDDQTPQIECNFPLNESDSNTMWSFMSDNPIRTTRCFCIKDGASTVWRCHNCRQEAEDTRRVARELAIKNYSDMWLQYSKQREYQKRTDLNRVEGKLTQNDKFVVGGFDHMEGWGHRTMDRTMMKLTHEFLKSIEEESIVATPYKSILDFPFPGKLIFEAPYSLIRFKFDEGSDKLRRDEGWTLGELVAEDNFFNCSNLKARLLKDTHGDYIVEKLGVNIFNVQEEDFSHLVQELIRRIPSLIHYVPYCN